MPPSQPQPQPQPRDPQPQSLSPTQPEPPSIHRLDPSSQTGEKGGGHRERRPMRHPRRCKCFFCAFFRVTPAFESLSLTKSCWLCRFPFSPPPACFFSLPCRNISLSCTKQNLECLAVNASFLPFPTRLEHPKCWSWLGDMAMARCACAFRRQRIIPIIVTSPWCAVSACSNV
jgi:hypothetical protein